MGYYHTCEEGLMLGTYITKVLFILENEKEGLAISNLIDF